MKYSKGSGKKTYSLKGKDRGNQFVGTKIIFKVQIFKFLIKPLHVGITWQRLNYGQRGFVIIKAHLL